jgi:hypothetical protein
MFAVIVTAYLLPQTQQIIALSNTDYDTSLKMVANRTTGTTHPM